MKKQSREAWSHLDTKTKIAYITAIVAFIIGWGLTIAGFIVPPLGAVADSVLWILGQSLLYAASVFGVGMYTTNAVRGMRRDIRQFMRDEDIKFRHEEYEPQVESTDEVEEYEEDTD